LISFIILTNLDTNWLLEHGNLFMFKMGKRGHKHHITLNGKAGLGRKIYSSTIGFGWEFLQT
jgi:hypothetical protein